MGKKGQIAVEYILIMSILVLLILTTYFVLDKEVLSEKRLKKIDIYANRIIQNAEILNSLEEDSTRIVEMNIGTINSVTFQNYQIIINSTLQQNLITKSTMINITGVYNSKNSTIIQLTKKNGAIIAQNVW